MLQSVLFFILGLLVAIFLVALVAPAVWRRAAALTHRRIEAAAPLTLAEIQADKDRIRAGFAMTARRLEMEIKALKENGALQAVEIGRAGEDLKAMAAERDSGAEALAAAQAKATELQDVLDEREAKLRILAENFAEAERMLTERADEMDKLGQLYEEASFSSSSRQIELVARESDLEKLSNDLSVLRAQRKEADKRHQELVAQGKAASLNLKAEKKKVAELDRKLERMFAKLADREDKLERREGELARLRQKLKAGGPVSKAAFVAKAEGGARAVKEDQGGKIEIDLAIARLNSDRERLEERLTALARENERLKAGLSDGEAPLDGTAGATQRDGALREQMSDLAAEVVHLAAMLEGPDSQIATALASPDSADVGDAGMRSLADRVRALQKASSPD